jgi:hypothetical protein
MSRSYKPPGYSTLSPYLVVDGATRVIHFAVRAFRATADTVS